MGPDDLLALQSVKPPEQVIRGLFPEPNTPTEFDIEPKSLIERVIEDLGRRISGPEYSEEEKKRRREFLKYGPLALAGAAIGMDPLTDALAKIGHSEINKTNAKAEPGINKGSDLPATNPVDVNTSVSSTNLLTNPVDSSANGSSNRGGTEVNYTDEEIKKVTEELEELGKKHFEGMAEGEGEHSEKLSYLGYGVMLTMMTHFGITVGQISASKGEKQFNEFSAARSIALLYGSNALLQKLGNEADKEFGHHMIHEFTGGEFPLNLTLTAFLSVLTNVTEKLKNDLMKQLDLDEARIKTNKPQRNFLERVTGKLGGERQEEMELDEEFDFFESVKTEGEDRTLIEYSSTDLRTVVQEKILAFNQKEGEDKQKEKDKLVYELQQLKEFYTDMVVSTTSRGMGLIGALSPIFTTYLGSDLGNQLSNSLLDIATKKQMVEEILINLDKLSDSNVLEGSLMLLEVTSANNSAEKMNKLNGLRGAIMFYAANVSGFWFAGDPPNAFAIPKANERGFLMEYLKKSQLEGFAGSMAGGLLATVIALHNSFDISIGSFKDLKFMSEFGKGLMIGLKKTGKGLAHLGNTIDEITRGTKLDRIDDFRVVKIDNINNLMELQSFHSHDGQVVSLERLVEHIKREDMTDREKENLINKVQQLSYSLEEATTFDLERLKGLVNENQDLDNYELYKNFLYSEEAKSAKSFDELIDLAQEYAYENGIDNFEIGQFAELVLELSDEVSPSDALIREYLLQVKTNDPRSFVMPGYLFPKSIEALARELTKGGKNVAKSFKFLPLKEWRDHIGNFAEKFVSLESDDHHHEERPTVFDLLVEGKEITVEDFIIFMNQFNPASGSVDGIQDMMGMLGIMSTEKDVPMGSEMPIMSKFMGEFITKLAEHRKDPGMVKVLNEVNKFFEFFKDKMKDDYKNGKSHEALDKTQLKPELVDILLKAVGQGVAMPDLLKSLGVSYDDLNKVDSDALENAILRMAKYNYDADTVSKELGHSAKEVLYALLTQLSHVGAMVEFSKTAFNGVDSLMGDMEPKTKLMLKIGISSLLGTGVSMFADNVAAFLFGIATNDRIIDEYIQEVGGLPGGEKQEKELKLEGFMLSLWTAIMAGSLFKSGNGPNFALLNLYPQAEIIAHELSDINLDNEPFIRDYVISSMDDESAILDKLKKLGLSMEAAQKWYRENIHGLAVEKIQKTIFLKPKALITPTGSLDTRQSPVDFIETFKMSKYWSPIILALQAFRMGMLLNKANTISPA